MDERCSSSSEAEFVSCQGVSGRLGTVIRGSSWNVSTREGLFFQDFHEQVKVRTNSTRKATP